MKPNKPEKKPVTRITSGASRVKGDRYVGMTVAGIREKLGAELNIPEGATARVGSRVVSANYKFKDGDQLEFSKRAGKHG